MRKIIVTLAVAGLVVAFGAAPGVAGGGNLKKFCKADLAVEQADQPSTKQLNRLLDTAPPEIADAVETAVTIFQDEGEAAFENPEFQDAYGELNNFVAENCADETIDIVMQDYAFTGLPDEVDAGVIGFVLTNEGTELHEFHVVRLKGDATADDLLDAEEHEFEDLAVTIAEGFAAPGESSAAIGPFKKPGRYVAICELPVGATDEASIEAAEDAGAPSHAAEGMIAEFEVVK